MAAEHLIGAMKQVLEHRTRTAQATYERIIEKYTSATPANAPANFFQTNESADAAALVDAMKILGLSLDQVIADIHSRTAPQQQQACRAYLAFSPGDVAGDHVETARMQGTTIRYLLLEPHSTSELQRLAFEPFPGQDAAEFRALKEVAALWDGGKGNVRAKVDALVAAGLPLKKSAETLRLRTAEGLAEANPEWKVKLMIARARKLQDAGIFSSQERIAFIIEKLGGPARTYSNNLDTLMEQDRAAVAHRL